MSPSPSGRIVAHRRRAPTSRPTARSTPAACVVAPGLVDLAARLREPGQEHEGMLESELAAAAAGGVTSLVCPPDTDPVLDEPGLVEMLKFRARKLSRCRALPARRADARPAGRGADRDGRADRGRLRRLLAGRRAGHRHPGAAARAAVRGDLRLHGVAAAAGRLAGQGRGGAAARWPRGWACPACRWRPRRWRCTTIFELVRATGARVHLCRLSSAAGVALLRAAKAEGLPVTADVSINSLHLTDVDIGYFNADMRLTPPLRQGADRDALRAALADGTIDALVSDHTPVADDAKNLPFGEAEPGATGLELLLSLALRWGADSGLPLATALARVTQRPGARARRRAGLAGQQRRPAGRRRRRRPLPVRPRGRLDRDARARWPARASTRRSPSTPPAWRCPAACAPRWWPARWPTKRRDLSAAT